MTSDHIWYLLATGTPCKPHRMALNQTDLIKINVKICNAGENHKKALSL